MKFTKDTKILIIGLGVIGGSYAKALTDKGYSIKCITKERADVRFGLEHGMISYGTTEIEPELIKEAELIVFALYPKAFIDWIKKISIFSPPEPSSPTLQALRARWFTRCRICSAMTWNILRHTLWQDVRGAALNMLTQVFSTERTIL